MKKLKKIKLSDISDKQSLNVNQLSKIIGGAGMDDACASSVCESNLEANTKYCDGGAICTSAISTCVTSAESNDQDKPEGGGPVDKPTCVLALCITEAYY